MSQATIQRVLSVSPIEGADRLEKVMVKGWQVVVRKGEFRVGDNCVYVEIDSLLPELEEFSFLASRGVSTSASGSKGYRVRTAKLRGCLSQGICFCPDSLMSVKDFCEKYPELEVGEDVSELLGITHYDKPVSLDMSGIARGGRPGYIRKTDEERLQSFPEVLHQIYPLDCVVTVKLDGTSATYSHFDSDVHVCGRNISYEITHENAGNLYLRIEERYGITDRLRSHGNYAVQGEICGPGIQKNPLGLNEIDFFVFDMFDIEKCRYIGFKETVRCAYELGLKFVPVEYTGQFSKYVGADISELDRLVEELLVLSRGMYYGTSRRREGLVIRSADEVYSPVLCDRLSFKVVNNEYLLKDEE